MRYLMLVLGTPDDPGLRPEEAEAAAPIEEWVGRHYGSGAAVVGDRLRPPEDAVGVRVRGGKVLVTDGPFSETKESIAGFDVLEAPTWTPRSPSRPSTPWRTAARSSCTLHGRWTSTGPELTPATDPVEDAFRTEWARVLGAVARSTGDLDLAEESAQEAFAAALRTWGRDGVPERPGAWLTTTARRHAIDVLRRRRVEAERVAAAGRLGERVDPRHRGGVGQRIPCSTRSRAASTTTPGTPTTRTATSCACSSRAATRRCPPRRGSRSPCGR